MKIYLSNILADESRRFRLEEPPSPQSESVLSEDDEVFNQESDQMIRDVSTATVSANERDPDNRGLIEKIME